MSAYDVMDSTIAGLKSGIDSRVEGGWACADSNGIAFGKPVFGYRGDPINVYNYFLDVDKMAFDADFVTGNTIDITVNGVAAAQVTFDTDHDTTAGLVAAAVAALTGVECVLDPADTDNRTFLIRTKGATCVSSEVVASGASQATGTITSHSGQVYLGVAMFVQKVSDDGATASKYDQYDAVNVMNKGEIWCDSTGTCEANNEAYVYATAGADFGKVGASGEAINARFRSNATSGALVRIYTDGQSEMDYADSF
jgi:hypothetical protein